MMDSNKLTVRAILVGLSWVMMAGGIGCNDRARVSKDFETHCRKVEANLAPGSDVPWFRADDLDAWNRDERPMLAHEAMAAYRGNVIARKQETGRSALSAEEHAEAFRDALTAHELTVPECGAWMAFNARLDIYERRMKELYPLCDAYDDQVTVIRPAGLEADDHDRVFKEVAAKWRTEQARPAEALELIDKLLAMGRLERGQRIRAEIETYMTAPGFFNSCRRLVWDAEKAAGLRVSSIE